MSEEIDYKTYIQSDEWRAKAAGLIVSRGSKCETCPSSETLGVHHITYDNLGNEADDQLAVLCVRCHARMHSGKPIKHGTVACINVTIPRYRPTDEWERSPRIEISVLSGVRSRKHVVIADRITGKDEDTGGLIKLSPIVDVLDFFSEADRERLLYKLGDCQVMEWDLAEAAALLPLADAIYGREITPIETPPAVPV